jgi:hypothetical protein
MAMLRGIVLAITDCQSYAPHSHNYHSWTMDHYHNHGNIVCYIKEIKMKLLQFHLQVIVSGLLFHN